MINVCKRCTADLIPVGLNPFMELPDEGAGHIERETFYGFLQLPAAQRKIIREVILTFAKANGLQDAPVKK
jgi:hypothetical protein